MSATEQTNGIVLRVFRYSETSLIVHWLTEDQGRVATLARGALRPKSDFRAKLDLFHACQLTFQRNHRSTLHVLREVSLIRSHDRISHDLRKVRQASYLSQLITKSTEEDTPIEGLFEMLTGCLSHLNAPLPAHLSGILCFEFRLLQNLGLEPQWNQDRISLACRELIKIWNASPAAWDFESIAGSRAVQQEMFGYLGRFMAYHLGLPPKLRAELIAEA